MYTNPLYPSLAFALILSVFSSCTIVRPGEVGVKQKLGKLSNKTHSQGVVWFNPFLTKVIKANVQLSDIELSISLPTKEGLSVVSQISILYRVNKDSVPMVIRNIGLEYETIISNVFRSASADVCSEYYAKDMHSGMRAEIEEAIKSKMSATLSPQGINVHAVLMKSIQLPAGLANSIEQKLQAEQDAMRMEFVLRQERLEAERKIIEATGTRDAQKILSEGLTENIIRLRGIEAFLELSKSSNSKVIITDGKAPLLLD
ncbi:MAG: prohibitin family protein [Cytophagaceae bacterium]|jgi:regulator of protease activity HflC (stomatin/prohibitin superfamily)|nr:prohibitin family protein [Cytophagaceae bacterium]